MVQIHSPHTVLYIAISADGYIADAHGGVDWLPQDPSNDFGYQEFFAQIDAIVMGRTTYLQNLDFIKQGIIPDLPYEGKPVIVVSSQTLANDRSDVIIVSSMQEYHALVAQHPHWKTIWLMGGAQLIQSFINENLIDESIITIIPVSIGAGIALPTGVCDGMKLVATVPYSDGIVQHRYVHAAQLV